MQTYIFDVEGNGLAEYHINRKKVGTKECDRIHILVLRSYPDGKVQVFRHNDEENTIAEGWDILRSADVVIGHNIIQYDLPVLSRLYGGDVKGKVFDTLVAARLLWPDAKNHPFGGNSLKAFGKHLNCAKGDYEGGWETWNESMEEYCVRDTLVSTAIFDYVKPKCQSFKRPLQLEHMVAMICARMQNNGVAIDIPTAEYLVDQFDLIKARCMQALLKEFPDIVTERISEKTGKTLKPKVTVFNPGSAAQVADRLLAKYGWVAPLTKPNKKTGSAGGNPSVTEDVLKKLTFPEAKLILHHDMADMRLGHLADWIKRARNSRTPGIIHPQINTNGCATHRGSHQQPNQTACPKVKSNADGPLKGYPGRYGWEMRSLWGPTTPGNVMVGADASGLELRLLGDALYPWDKGEYADRVVMGDVHQRTANATGMTRNAVKEPTYACLYGAGIDLLDDLTNGKGEKFKRGFEDSIACFGQLKSWCSQCASEKGFLPLLDGRHAPIRSEHAALSSLLQGNGAVFMKVAMVICDQTLTKGGLRYGWMLWPHDEFQIEAHPDDAEEVGKIMVASIEYAGKVLRVKCPMSGEYKIGSNWAETH